MIAKQIIDQVMETANAHIVDVVGDYVQLRRRGSSYMACCPFHSEKTPSFSVTPAKGICYCFGCHKGGNAVNFVMEIEKLTFPEAIRFLGRRFGIDVPDVSLSPEQDQAQRERDNLYAITEYAAKQFESNLRETQEGQTLGLEYFRHRGFRDDIIALFRLGYAMQRPDDMITRAHADGYSDQMLIEAGLVSVDEQPDGTKRIKADKFRGRVIFPIQNATGKVIAFGGRLLDTRTKGVTLKYLNSPETKLYVKSDIVYGIFQARTAISRENKCFLVEGYTDVISMHQSGIANVVASSGTALTVNQIRLIKRFTTNITVLYDGDNAGIHASLRGIDMILHEGMNVKVLLLPGGQDPDEFARTHPADEFKTYVQENETDFIRFEAENLMKIAGNDPVEKARTTHTIIGSIAEVQDQIQREYYVQECSRIMGISESILFSELQKQLVNNATKERNMLIQQQRREEFARLQAQQQQNIRSNGNQFSPTSQGLPQTQLSGGPAQVGQNGLTAGPTGAPTGGPAPYGPDDMGGLSPNELAQMGMMSGGGYSAPPTYGTRNGFNSGIATQPSNATDRGANPDTEMREVVRLFITYTQNRLMEQEGQPTVGDFIISTLDTEDITSHEEMLNIMLDFYRQAPDKSQVSITQFTAIPDARVSAFIAHAVGGRQELSKIHSRYAVVEPEEKQLDYLVPRALNELRMVKLLKMIDEATDEMNRLTAENAPDEKIEEAMAMLRDLTEVKRELAMELGERAIVR